ncbi:transposase [Paenibacillus cymbidii]|uniref:transposase n=1 Tax=Paenibacillus cymbidii TaxID=1639034 RepID=UPI001080F9E5
MLFRCECKFGKNESNVCSGVVLVAKKEPMNLIQFQKAFQTEEACHNHLMKMKWPEVFRCPKCQHDKAYEITTRSCHYLNASVVAIKPPSSQARFSRRRALTS